MRALHDYPAPPAIVAAPALPSRAYEAHNVPCACGGVLTVQALTRSSIRKAVRRHNATAGHVAWRDLGGFDRA